MNIERIQGVMEFIEFGEEDDHNGHSFDMHCWSSKTDILGWDFDECGTTLCIGGTAIHLYATDDQKRQLQHQEADLFRAPSTVARELLDLDPQQAQNLFYWTGGGEEPTAEVAVNTLQNLIDTGEVRW